MNDHRQGTRWIASESPADEEAMRELLESAGRRPAVPAEDLAAIKAAARSEWQELVAAGRKRRLKLRRSVIIALAASLILAVAIWRWKPGASPAVSGSIATVQLLKGEIRVEGPPGHRVLAVGDSLAAGSVLATEQGASPALVALHLAGGESVRLDSHTRVRLVSRARLDLMAGALYVDSGRPASGGSLEIRTPFGSVRDVGTQFEVRLGREGDPALRVRVREGMVALVRHGGTDSVAKGEELRLRRDGRASRATIEPQGAAWSWVLAAAPSLDIEGVRLSDYLGWVSRETAWRLRYEDEALAELAAGIRLHGSIEGLAPDESVSVVMPGSGLGYRVEGTTLLVTRTRS